MSVNLPGSGEVYDGEFYLADVTFAVRGNQGWIRVKEYRAVFPLHHELVENGKTLTLRCPERQFSIRYGGIEKQKVFAGAFQCTWSILVEEKDLNSERTTGRYAYPPASDQTGNRQPHQPKR